MPCPRQTWGIQLLITKMKKNVSVSVQQVKRRSLLALGNLLEEKKGELSWLKLKGEQIKNKPRKDVWTFAGQLQF